MSVLGSAMLLTIPSTASAVTWNPSDKSSNITLSNNDLTYSANSSGGSCRATVGKSTGKWYWEVLIVQVGSVTPYTLIGILPFDGSIITALGLLANTGYTYRGTPWSVTGPNNAQSGPGTTAQANGQTIGFALDCDGHTLAIYVNNTLTYTLTGIATTTWYPACGSATGTASGTANFGPSFTYTPPTGYSALS